MLRLLLRSLRVSLAIAVIFVGSVSYGSFDRVLRELGAENGVPVIEVIERKVRTQSDYVFVDYTLGAPEVGRIEVSVRVPARDFENGNPLPAIFMSTGFHVGKDTTALVGDIGRNIVVSYEYGLADVRQTVARIQENRNLFRRTGDVGLLRAVERDVFRLVTEIPNFIEIIKRMPLQMAAVLKWLSHQSEVDRLSVVGVSLGTQMLPLAQRIFESHGGVVEASVFAYGGANVGYIVEPVLRSHMGSLETAFAQDVIRALLNGYDSAEHLAHLRSRHYLVVHAEKEEIFSSRSQNELERLLPRPDVMRLKGPHINGNTNDLIEVFVDSVYRWGIEKSVINPN